MTDHKSHISVCVCTYKRPELLGRLLEGLREQQTKDRFTWSIVVADNDRWESAKPTVTRFATSTGIQATYCVEPRQNIALTRNLAVQNATGDFVAFCDDDELPVKRWLLTLFEACEHYGCSGVLGTTKPYFEVQPPDWVIRGAFHERPSYPTGLVIDWRKGRTSNVLLRRRVFKQGEEPFRPAFRTGEDRDFFRRMIDQGHRFVWCNEVLTYETIPPVRWRRSFMLGRALLRGQITLQHPVSSRINVMKSVIAVPAYTIALPFLLLGGQHLFMKYLIKSFDHAGRLLAFVGLDPVKDAYVTE